MALGLRAVLVAACVALAACGHATKPRRAAARPSGPCVAQARVAVAAAAGAGAGAGQVRMRTTDASPGMATCAYEAVGLSVRASVDTNPQALVRFERAVVERDQVAVWSSQRSHAPRLLQGIGEGADWFPADRELLSTDGRKLVSVVVARSTLSARRALALAKAVTRATLGHGG